MRRRRVLAAVGSAAALGVAGCLGGGPTATSTDYDVGMGATSFEPAEVTTSVGETVRWRNTNSRAHTVTAYADQLPEGAAYFATGGYETEQAARDAFFAAFGGALASSETYEHTFEGPGRYAYFCIPHERAGMVGTVVVDG